MPATTTASRTGCELDLDRTAPTEATHVTRTACVMGGGLANELTRTAEATPGPISELTLARVSDDDRLGRVACGRPGDDGDECQHPGRCAHEAPGPTVRGVRASGARESSSCGRPAAFEEVAGISDGSDLETERRRGHAQGADDVVEEAGGRPGGRPSAPTGPRKLRGAPQRGAGLRSDREEARAPPNRSTPSTPRPSGQADRAGSPRPTHRCSPRSSPPVPAAGGPRRPKPTPAGRGSRPRPTRLAELGRLASRRALPVAPPSTPLETGSPRPRYGRTVTAMCPRRSARPSARSVGLRCSSYSSSTSASSSTTACSRSQSPWRWAARPTRVRGHRTRDELQDDDQQQERDRSRAFDPEHGADRHQEDPQGRGLGGHVHAGEQVSEPDLPDARQRCARSRARRGHPRRGRSSPPPFHEAGERRGPQERHQCDDHPEGEVRPVAGGRRSRPRSP